MAECNSEALKLHQKALTNDGMRIDAASDKFLERTFPNVDGPSHPQYGDAMVELTSRLYNTMPDKIDSFLEHKHYIEQVCGLDSELTYTLSDNVMFATGIPEFDFVLRIVMGLSFAGAISFVTFTRFRLNNLFKIR